MEENWAPPGTASASTHECDAGEGLKSGMSLQVFPLLIEGRRIKKASAASSNHWTPSHWNNVTSSKSLKATLSNLNSTFGWYLLMEWLRNWSTWCCYASLSLVCSETKTKAAQEETQAALTLAALLLLRICSPERGWRKAALSSLMLLQSDGDEVGCCHLEAKHLPPLY